MDAEGLGAQLVIEALKYEGITTVYVLPGDPVGSIVNNVAALGMPSSPYIPIRMNSSMPDKGTQSEKSLDHPQVS